MAFTEFPIETATILQHLTASVVDSNSYLLVQHATGATEKVSVGALALALGLTQRFDTIADFRESTINAALVVIVEDGNGNPGLFVPTDDEPEEDDGVNYCKNADDDWFKRVQLT